MDQGHRPLLFTLAVAAALPLLAGCGGGQSLPTTHATALPTAPPTATPTPTPLPTLAPQRLYVSALVDAAPVSYFTAPFSNASLPASSFPILASGEAGGLTVGPTGNVLWTDIENETITSNSRPSPTSSVQYTINLPSFVATSLAFSPTGTLFVANGSGGQIDTVSAPLSAASTITPLVTTGLGHPVDITFDAAGNLYDADSGGFLAVYAPPYTGSPIILNTGTQPDFSVAYDTVTNQIAVAQGKGFGSVLFYNLPITAASTPSATYAFNAGESLAVAFDRTGNLYLSLSTATANSINVYAPPFLTGTNPVPTLSFATPIFATTPEPVYSMAFGT